MMADELEERDLQKFLRDVDEIANLVQGLNSTDPAVQEKAISDTEKRLHIQEVRDDGECKTKLNRTIINSQDATASWQHWRKMQKNEPKEGRKMNVWRMP